MTILIGGKKMIKRLFQGALVAGLLIFFIARTCAQLLSMSDFVKGFLEGMSAVFIVVGLIYIARCYIKNKNTYIQ